MKTIKRFLIKDFTQPIQINTAKINVPVGSQYIGAKIMDEGVFVFFTCPVKPSGLLVVDDGSEEYTEVNFLLPNKDEALPDDARVMDVIDVGLFDEKTDQNSVLVLFVVITSN